MLSYSPISSYKIPNLLPVMPAVFIMNKSEAKNVCVGDVLFFVDGPEVIECEVMGIQMNHKGKVKSFLYYNGNWSEPYSTAKPKNSFSCSWVAFKKAKKNYKKL